MTRSGKARSRSVALFEKKRGQKKRGQVQFLLLSALLDGEGYGDTLGVYVIGPDYRPSEQHTNVVGMLCDDQRFH